MTLQLVPVTLKQANKVVSYWHRHHQPVAGALFSVALTDCTNTIVGVAIVGRPVSRMLDDGWTVEVNRVCTDGTRNGCSMLLGACWRTAKAMGYLRIITYTLPSEGGASLRGAGWDCLGERGGGSWSRDSRKREDEGRALGVKHAWFKGTWETPKSRPLMPREPESKQEPLFSTGQGAP